MSLQNNIENGTLDARHRALWVGIRQALIISLGAVEDYMGVERSIIPRHKRIGWSPDAPGRAQAHATSESAPAVDERGERTKGQR